VITVTDPYLRKDVWMLPPDDPIITAYAGAVASMKAKPANDPTSWSYQAAIHGTYASSPLPEWNQCKHGSWYFLSWHRTYVYFFERIVRAEVVANGGPPTWALPYWNYDGGSGHNALPSAFRGPTAPDGTPNSLFVTDRNPGINAGAGIPSAITSASFALGRPFFTGASEFGGGVGSALDQFWTQTGRLEQTPHNDIHVTIGGLMGDPDTAAEDPIFWLHHANIDRLWWFWERQGHLNPPDQPWRDQGFEFSDEQGSGVSLTGMDVENTVEQLGYSYDPDVPQRVGPPILRPAAPPPWPLPWPSRGGLAVTGPEPPAGPPERQLVGATSEPLRLVGEAQTVPVEIDERTTGSLRTGLRAEQHEQRAFVDVEDIEAERNPGVVYGVYVNLPDDPTQDDLARHHVGNVSLFGVERARDPRGDQHGHGLRVSMEITELLDRLASEGTWQEGGRLLVTFRPIGLEAPPTEPLGIAPATGHPDNPVTIGRVSVHFS
jgi:Common central domain of tyrosinase